MKSMGNLSQNRQVPIADFNTWSPEVKLTWYPQVKLEAMSSYFIFGGILAYLKKQYTI
jgi:hypothetical protein